MELGFYSLGEWLADPLSGRKISAPQRLDEILAAGVLAEELGAAVFGVGEHHARHWVVSSPAVVLSALAARTRRIRLASTVSLLATLDPVRVAQDYATVDVISGGRLDLMIGKGIAAEPYALFDVDIEQQRDALAEHLHLLRQIWATPAPLRWKGRFRAPIVEHTIHPRPVQNPPPIWLGASSGFESVELAAAIGSPIFLGGVGKPMEHYGVLVDHYRERWAHHGHAPEAARVGSGSHLFIRSDSQAARRAWRPYFEHYQTISPRVQTASFDEMVAGPTICGSPAEAVDKLLAYHARYGHDLHLLQVDLGGLPYAEVTRTMELVATEVLPVIARETGASQPTAAAA